MSAPAPDEVAALRARAAEQWQRTLVDRRGPMPRIPWGAIGGILLLAVGCLILLASGHGSGSGGATHGTTAAPTQVTPYPAPQGLPPEFFG